MMKNKKPELSLDFNELKKLILKCDTFKDVEILKQKIKGIHSTTLNGRKVLTAKMECEQKNCSFYKKGCKPCKDCKSRSGVICPNCQTCFDCENKPNSLRWDNKKMLVKNKLPPLYQDMAEELELKEDLMTIMVRMQELQNRNKQRGKGSKEDEEEEKVRIPSYTG